MAEAARATRVKRGDIIAVVDTEKGAIEIEVFEDGVLERAARRAGEKVPVGTVLAMIRGPGAPHRAAAAAPPARARAAPTARRRASAGGAQARARMLGVDLAHGARHRSGRARSRARTSSAAAAARRPAPTAPASGAGRRDAAAAMRAAIAAAMARSKREIPHYYLSHDDRHDARRWPGCAPRTTAAVPDRLLPVVLLIKAVALALREVPELNGYWIGRRASGRAPASTSAARSRCAAAAWSRRRMHDADRQDLTTLMRELRDLVRGPAPARSAARS